jgi:peptidylprolyl isomerase
LGIFAAACAGARTPPEPVEPARPTEVAVPEPGASEPQPDDEPPPAPSGPTGARVEPDGLRIEELVVGRGDEARAGNRVLVHYDGTLTDGTTFDSSRERGTPFEVELGKGHLIPGFERGVLGMRPGGRRRVVIPPELGYGTQRTGKIPPSSVLVFEIELLEIR